MTYLKTYIDFSGVCSFDTLPMILDDSPTPVVEEVADGCLHAVCWRSFSESAAVPSLPFSLPFLRSA